MSMNVSGKPEKKYNELSENENTVYQNLWDVAKEVLRRKFITPNLYMRKAGNVSNQLSFYLKNKESKIRPKKKERTN